MKLVRYGKAGEESPAVLLDNTLVDVTNLVDDFDPGFLAHGALEDVKGYIESGKFDGKELSGDIRLGPPLTGISKIVCVGLNYAKHAQESGMDVPTEPVLFFKSTTAVVGAFDNVVIPRGSTKTDWEVELAVVIGKEASYVPKEDAMEHVAGYMVHNDISERAFQLEKGGQWVKGKSCDTFAPLGPYLVTSDEIANPHNLDLWLRLNGETMQSSNTSDLIFDIPTLVSYISGFMTLLPGDIISTGTPFGVGLGLNPPKYLKPGDVMELGIAGLGISKQKVVAYSEQSLN
ncbi:MAG: fumarylacetoacetate hydrolase family protein [Bacteroidota bacterium]